MQYESNSAEKCALLSNVPMYGKSLVKIFLPALANLKTYNRNGSLFVLEVLRIHDKQLFKTKKARKLLPHPTNCIVYLTLKLFLKTCTTEEK